MYFTKASCRLDHYSSVVLLRRKEYSTSLVMCRSYFKICKNRMYCLRTIDEANEQVIPSHDQLFYISSLLLACVKIGRIRSYTVYSAFMIVNVLKPEIRHYVLIFEWMRLDLKWIRLLQGKLVNLRCLWEIRLPNFVFSIKLEQTFEFQLLSFSNLWLGSRTSLHYHMASAFSHPSTIPYAMNV